MITLRIPNIPKPVVEAPSEEPATERPVLSRPALAAPRFPRGLTTLSLSWMHGRFEAVAITRGEVTGTWENPEVNEDLGRFGDWVKAAAARTGYHGSSVNLLLAHPRLTHQLIETPPAKGAALKAVVQRQVERLKGFEGPPAWGFQAAMPTKSSTGVLVHLFPRNLLDQLVAATQKAGFHLHTVAPCTAVLHAQLGRLALKAEDIALIAADTAGMTTVVVGRPDGQLLLARSLDVARNPGAGALAVDLNRTLLFVAQQYGSAVGSVWLFGTTSPEGLAELQAQVQVPLRQSPEEHAACYWAHEAAHLPVGQTPNLISNEQRKAPQRRVLLRMTFVVTLALLAGAGIAVGVFQVLARREQVTIRDLEQRLVGLQAQHQDLQRVHLQLERQSEFARTVLDDRWDPVPVWMLGYLSEAVPPGLTLTRFSMQRRESQWNLQLTGIPQNPGATPSGSLNASVEAFAELLRSGPFHVDLSLLANGLPTTAAPRLVSAVESIANWAARVKPAPAATPVQPTDHFVLEGHLQ